MSWKAWSRNVLIAQSILSSFIRLSKPEYNLITAAVLLLALIVSLTVDLAK